MILRTTVIACLVLARFSYVELKTDLEINVNINIGKNLGIGNSSFIGAIGRALRGGIACNLYQNQINSNQLNG